MSQEQQQNEQNKSFKYNTKKWLRINYVCK